ncbi:MAG: hypothetical protein NXI24_06820 [bacterium]|nr:hypothetical protein [bacterium]
MQFAAALLTAGCTLASGGCQPKPDDGPLHLVIDAGSSGTRLCLFEIQRSCDTDSQACACHAPEARTAGQSTGAGTCQSIPDSPGLATLPPAGAATALARGLEQSLAPAIIERLQGAVLLGTGGFRQVPAERRAAIVQALSSELKHNIEASGVAVLSGSDEGRLAWLAMREIEESSSHAILETGGASVQFAGGPDSQAIESISLPIGINKAFESLQSDPQLARCYPFGAPDGQTDFDDCRAAIRRAVFSDAAAKSLTKAAAGARDAGDDAGRLFGLGSSWRAVFAGMDQSKVSLSELLHFGRRVCAERKLTEQERTSKYLKRRCYLYAYQSVLLEETGFDRITRGNESWPRGAAISGEFFPACSAP